MLNFITTKIQILTLVFFSFSAWSAGPLLSGNNAIIFPDIEVSFLQSETLISAGTKNADGSCTFPLTSESSPLPLNDSQHWITIQRGFDPDTCEELLEKGIIDLDINPEAKKLLNIPDQSSAKISTQSRNTKIDNTGNLKWQSEVSKANGR